MINSLNSVESAAYFSRDFLNMGIFVRALRPNYVGEPKIEEVVHDELSIGGARIFRFSDEKRYPLSRKILQATQDFAPGEYIPEREQFKITAQRVNKDLGELNGFWQGADRGNEMVTLGRNIIINAFNQATFENSDVYSISPLGQQNIDKIQMLGISQNDKTYPYYVIYDKGDQNKDKVRGIPTAERLIIAIERGNGIQDLVIFHQLNGQFVSRVVTRKVREDTNAKGDYTVVYDTVADASKMAEINQWLKKVQ